MDPRGHKDPSKSFLLIEKKERTDRLHVPVPQRDTMFLSIIQSGKRDAVN